MLKYLCACLAYLIRISKQILFKFKLCALSRDDVAVSREVAAGDDGTVAGHGKASANGGTAAVTGKASANDGTAAVPGKASANNKTTAVPGKASASDGEAGTGHKVEVWAWCNHHQWVSSVLTYEY